MNLYVIKFGGSVLTDYESLMNAAAYIIKKQKENRVIAVPSAFSGITNVHKGIFKNIRDPDYYPIKRAELRYIYSLIFDRFPRPYAEGAMNEIDEHLKALDAYVQSGSEDAIVGSGEQQAGIILRYFVEALEGDVEYINSADAGFLIKENRSIDIERSAIGLRKTIGARDPKKALIIPGYVGRHVDTHVVRTGTRNSTDSFASAVGYSIDADTVTVEIIKDVPAICRVEKRYGNYGTLNALSYDESGEMTWKGSPVVHPEAINIASLKKIPIVVKNLDPDSKGTLISTESQTTKENPVAAIVVVYQPMINVIDSLMTERTGYLHLLTGFETRKGNSIDMVSTGNKSVSYTVSLGDVKSDENIDQLLALHLNELKNYMNSMGFEPSVDGEVVAKISAVGKAMQGTPGILRRIYGTTEAVNVSVRANSQSDEKPLPPTVSFAVDADKADITVKALCEELFK